MGYFGPVTIGISRSDVLRNLGEPDWFQKQSTREGNWNQEVKSCTG